MFSLAGKVAVVTGGSSGIGRALGQALAEAGASTVMVARRGDRLAEAITAIEASGGKAAAVVADLADHHAVDGPAAAMSEPFGAPDILINAAGVNFREAAEDVTPESWDGTLAINLSVPFFLAKALQPAMAARGWGRVINIASLQTVRAMPNGIAYGASKGGVGQLTRAMAEAWGKSGITANAIAPGFFPTELTAPVFADAARSAHNADQTALGRNGKLEDLAGTAVYLASPASDYVSGQTIFVDGGFTAK
jgi:gluconate 5-dehydrogenase